MSTAHSLPSTVRRLTADELRRYQEDGFVVLRGFFAPEEVAPIAEACAIDPNFGGAAEAYATKGAPTPIVSWTELDDDSVFGVLPRLERVKHAIDALQGAEMYHYHSLLVRKGPQKASAFSWHTAYGSFYYDGCLFPDMVMGVVAVTRNTKENGCIRMVKGSHRLGRLDHVTVDGEVCADPPRMPHILARMEVVDIELAPGDVVFFDDNTIHGSGPNLTDESRIVLVLRYNAAHNEPYDVTEHADHRYTPLQAAADDTLRTGRFTRVYSPEQLWWGFRHKGYGGHFDGAAPDGEVPSA